MIKQTAAIFTRAAVAVAVGLFPGISATALHAGAPAADAPAIPFKPNILIIQSDDHGYADMSCTEIDTGAVTPNLDRIAGSGIRFTQGYATSPICTPSRIGLLLGGYQQRYNNWWYGGPGLPPDPKVRTIAEVLRDAGYATAMFGKYHVNRPFHPETRNFPLNHGFESFFGFNAPAAHYLRRGQAIEADFLTRVREHAPKSLGYPKMFYAPFWQNTERVEPEGFSTDVFADEAIRFIDRRGDRPFFVLLSFNAVHDTTSQLPDGYFQRHGVEPPRDWDPAVESEEAWTRATFSPEKDRFYLLGQLEYMDNAIGRLLDHLEATGQRDRTLIIYVADNGGSILNGSRNDPLRGGKFAVAEGGLRIPFLISWPGVFKEGITLPNVVSTMDLLPTAAAVAGAPLPEFIDGMDLTPLLTGTHPDLGHETLVWDGGVSARQWAIRHGDWKLSCVFPSPRTLESGAIPGFSLNNLASDVGETKNLILEHPDKAAELAALYRAWLEKMYPVQDFEEQP